jgi:Flp pilus assembly protein TadD
MNAQASEEFEKAARLLPDDTSIRYLLAQTLQKMGRSPEAAAQLQAAEKEQQRRRDASLATSNIILGAELLQKGDLGAAEAKLKEAVSLNPKDPLAHYHYGLALLLEDKLDTAVAQFHATLELRPDDPDTLYYLGRALLKKHQPAEAASSLQQALRVNPQDAHAHNLLAVALAGMKEFKAARDQLQQALALEPGNTLYRQNLNCLDRKIKGCQLVF